MGQLPQLVEALIARLEVALAEQARTPVVRASTETLLGKLKKQAAAMRAVVSASSGEGLTSEQAALVAQIPTSPVSLFPQWAQSKKESK